MSVLNRKSWKDVRRRWARSTLTSLTIAAAVASLSLFALGPLIDRAMDARVRNDHLNDIRFSLGDTPLSVSDLAAIEQLPGVAAVSAGTNFPTRLRVGTRRSDVLLVGVTDFAAQSVDVIRVESGAAPGSGEALSESRNVRSGRLTAGAGTEIQVEDNHGGLRSLSLSGRGSTLLYSQVAEDRAVVYLPQPDVNAIAGASGVNSLALRVDDPPTAQQTTDAVRAWLLQRFPEVEFTDLPEVRKAGTWPGQDIANNFLSLFSVGALLALVSAVALISNTMTTMVAEQRREIAIMKAIGGRRRQVIRSFLQTILILAALGTTAGVLLGIPFVNLLAQFIGRRFLGVSPGWGLYPPALLISVAIGIAGTLLAATPGLVRAARTTVRAGLASDVAVGGGSWVDGLLRRVRLPSTTRVGLRNITRRKTRTLGTVVQVGLAAGVALGFLGLGATVGDVTAQSWDIMSWDVIAYQRSNRALDQTAAGTLKSLDGAEVVLPVLYNNVQIGDGQYETWGMTTGSALYQPRIVSGRWLDAADSAQKRRVAVIGRALAAKRGLHVGDTFEAGTALGPVSFEVVGIDRNLINNGTNVFVPLETLQDVLGRNDTNAYWLVSRDRDFAAIDDLAARAEDALNAAGFPASTQIRHVDRAANISQNRVLVNVLAVMGIPIVAIGLIGLVNMMTMNVLERTREIGILRTVGARSKDITRIFRTEALSVAFLGWLLAVPLGWGIGLLLVRIVASLFDFGSLGYSFPWLYPLFALVATLGLAWLVVIAPLRRASHLRTGDALRYE
jgi:putative ABC transport system permease protein